MSERVRDAARQEQFLDVLDREEAARRFRAHLRLAPVGTEPVPLEAALGRVLAEDVVAEVDVPGFDRSGVDGFAVRAADLDGWLLYDFQGKNPIFFQLLGVPRHTTRRCYLLIPREVPPVRLRA